MDIHQLVDQITDDNMHAEVRTGLAVGNEIISDDEIEGDTAMNESDLHIGNVEHMTPEQEKVFFKKFERQLSEMDDSAARETLAMGHPITYSDDRYPGEVVREYPDGKRELIDLDENYNIIVKSVLP